MYKFIYKVIAKFGNLCGCTYLCKKFSSNFTNMSNIKILPFDLIRNNKYQYFKLCIDDVCLFDEFCEQIEKLKREKKSLISIFGLMEQFDLVPIYPKTKFRKIENVNRDDVFEFKKDNVRVYVIKQRPNIYIINGGFKKDQPKDIKKIGSQVKDFRKE